MDAIILSGLANLVVIGIGVYALSGGWRIFRLKSKKLLFTTRISLFFLERVKGRKAREEKEDELFEPHHARTYGMAAMLVGALLLVEAMIRMAMLFASG